MDRNRYVRVAGVLALATLLIVAGGCHKRTPVNPNIDTTGTAAGGDTSGGAEGAMPAEGSQDKLPPFAPSADLATVYFDYDKFTLRPDAIQTLNSNAAKMQAKPANVVFQVEGHCDARGTQEYNLALGEKRALAVREYLIRMGIDGSRLYTISYGKERPEVDGNNEAAWSKNRRAAFGEAVK